MLNLLKMTNPSKHISICRVTHYFHQISAHALWVCKGVWFYDCPTVSQIPAAQGFDSVSFKYNRQLVPTPAFVALL